MERHIIHPNSSSTRPANCASKTTKRYILHKRYTALATEAAGTISSLWSLQEATTTPRKFSSNKQCEFQTMNNSSGRWYRCYIRKDFLLGVKGPTNEFIILKLILKNTLKKAATNVQSCQPNNFSVKTSSRVAALHP